MKKLDLYIGIKFLKAFVLGLLAFLIIFILSSLFKVVGYIIDGKLSKYNGMVYLLSGIPESFSSEYPNMPTLSRRSTMILSAVLAPIPFTF